MNRLKLVVVYCLFRLLDKMSLVKTHGVLVDLDKIISDYFVRKADEEMSKTWNEGTLTDEKMKNSVSCMNVHHCMAAIENEGQYEWTVKRVENLLSLVNDGTPANDANSIELELLSNMVADYSDKHFVIGESLA